MELFSLSLHEKKTQGDADFPAEYYYVDCSHPRFQMPFQWHQEWEIIHVLRGTVAFRVDEQEMIAGEGDVLLLAEGFLHGGIPTDMSCVYECMVFHLAGLFSGVGSLSKQLTPFIHLDYIPFPFYPQQSYPELAQLVSKTMCACRHSKIESGHEAEANSQQLITIGCLSQIFGILLQKGLYMTEPFQGHASRVTQIKSVLEYIEYSYGVPITLEDLAAVAGVSPKYFCDVFRRITNKTPMDYVLFYRIEQACMLLSTTNLPITEVSLRCGFNDSSYFARRFKIQTGASPSSYRKQYRMECV